MSQFMWYQRYLPISNSLHQILAPYWWCNCSEIQNAVGAADVVELDSTLKTPDTLHSPIFGVPKVAESMTISFPCCVRFDCVIIIIFESLVSLLYQGLWIKKTVKLPPVNMFKCASNPETLGILKKPSSFSMTGILPGKSWRPPFSFPNAQNFRQNS